LFSLLSLLAWFLSLHILSGLLQLLSSLGGDLGILQKPHCPCVRVRPNFANPGTHFIHCPAALTPRKCATAGVNGIEAFPVEVEVNSGWGDTTVVIIVSLSPMVKRCFYHRKIRLFQPVENVRTDVFDLCGTPPFDVTEM
jgi:hypothetical protein